MQKRNGRSCGKVPVRLISGTCAAIALNPTVSGSFLFVFVEFNGASAKAVAMTLVVLLAYFVIFALFLFSPYFPSPPALCRHLLPRLRVVSSVQQLSVPLQHVCSCSLSDLLASHSSELPSAFLFL